MPDLDAVGNLISLNSEPGFIYNILLYIMFFLNMIAFFMQSDKQLVTTLMLGLTLAMLAIAKLNVIEPTNLAMLIINAGIFTIPFIVAGMSKSKASKPITVISGVIGGFYFFMYWFFLQNV